MNSNSVLFLPERQMKKSLLSLSLYHYPLSHVVGSGLATIGSYYKTNFPPMFLKISNVSRLAE